MGQAQINVRTRACSRTSIARTRQAALTHNVRGKELMEEVFDHGVYSLSPVCAYTLQIYCLAHLHSFIYLLMWHFCYTEHVSFIYIEQLCWFF